MKKLLIGSIAAAAIVAGPALAADLPVKAPPQLVATGYNWTGIYMGGSIGWLGTSDIGGPFVFPAAPGNSFIAPGVNGAAYGWYLGGQYQWGMFVLGVEGGMHHLFKSSFSSTPGLGNAPPVGCNAATVFACQGALGSIMQFGPRLGVAFDKFLAYGTGGWARAVIDTQAITIATGVPLAQAEVRHPGWFAGGGIEYTAFTLAPGIVGVLGVEYTHYKFNVETHDIGANSRFVSTTADTVMGRFSLKFGPAGAIVARY